MKPEFCKNPLDFSSSDRVASIFYITALYRAELIITGRADVSTAEQTHCMIANNRGEAAAEYFMRMAMKDAQDLQTVESEDFTLALLTREC